MRLIYMVVLAVAFSGFKIPENNATVVFIADPKENIRECTIGYRENGELVKITGVPENGRFVFKFNVSSIRKANLSYFMRPDVNTNQVKNHELIVEPGTTIVDMSGGTTRLSGTPFQEALDHFFNLAESTWSKFFPTEKTINLEQEGVRDRYEQYLLEKNKIWENYYEENKFPMVTAFTLEKYVTSRWVNLDNAEKYFDKLSPEIRALPDIKEFNERMQSSLVTGVGKKLPVVSLPDSAGKLMSTGDLEGKYVLVDFWAHWCKPCREENPELVRLYNKYRSRNFTILSVSLDDAKSFNDWKDAQKTDGMSWLNVIDKAGMSQSSIARKLNINSIPKNFLIDPSGVIIGKNLHGEELAKKIASLL